MPTIKHFVPTKRTPPHAGVKRSFYNSYHNRLASLRFAPPLLQQQAHTTTIAYSGLFFTNNRDFLECYNCQIRIGNWTTVDNPTLIHTRESPDCMQEVRKHDDNNNKTAQLYLILNDTTTTLFAELLFQAVLRLRNYQIFPCIQVEDLEIDRESTTIWNNTLHATIRNSYLTIYTQSLSIPATQRKPLLFPVGIADTPFQWYTRIRKMKHWALGDTVDVMPTEATMLRLWEATHPFTKYKYVQLNRMDQKRYTARRIEEVLASKGLMIGIEGPNLDNVVVTLFQHDKPITLVSTLLSHKIASFQIDETD